MKKLISLIFALCVLCSTVWAQFGNTGKTASFKSEILNVERNYNIYLPPSFNRNPDKTYPVLYLLHGGGGTNIDWFVRGHVADVAGGLLSAEEIGEMVIVSPDAGTGVMTYFNDKEWQYERFFFEEFIPYIEKTYRCGGSKQMRAIAGLSMGGQATFVYAFRHPELFSSAYEMSGYHYRHNLQWFNLKDPVQARVHQIVEDNNSVKLVQNATKEQIEAAKTVKWFFDCGDDDFTYDANVQLVDAMRKAGIPRQFRVREGGHTWEYWQSGLYIALPFVDNFFER